MIHIGRPQLYIMCHKKLLSLKKAHFSINLLLSNYRPIVNLVSEFVSLTVSEVLIFVSEEQN